MIYGQLTGAISQPGPIILLCITLTASMLLQLYPISDTTNAACDICLAR